MNNCIDIREQISLYIDNMLTESQMKSVEEHLAVCDACNQEYLELKEIKKLLSDIGDEEVPEEFDERLRTAFREECENMKISSTKFDNKNIVNIKKFNYKRLSAVAAVFVVGIFVIAMYNNNGQFEKEYEDINLVAPRLSDSLSLDRSVGDNSEYDMKYSELNNDENSENSIPYISEDDNVTAAKAGRSSIEMKYDTEANMNEYFDGNSGLNSDNIKDSIGDTDDISLNIESSERDMSNAIYSYDYYLELIEKDLIWTSFTVISWEKDSFDIYSFIIRLENDMKSESEQEYRLYKGSEGNILWEAINQ